MTIATRKLATVLGAVAVLTCLLDNRVLAAPNDADNVRNVVAGFATSWNRHDMDAFGKLFSPDAEFVNVPGDLWTGRRSIQAQHAYTHGRCVPIYAHPGEWRLIHRCRSENGKILTRT